MAKKKATKRKAKKKTPKIIRRAKAKPGENKMLQGPSENKDTTKIKNGLCNNRPLPTGNVVGKEGMIVKQEIETTNPQEEKENGETNAT